MKSGWKLSCFTGGRCGTKQRNVILLLAKRSLRFGIAEYLMWHFVWNADLCVVDKSLLFFLQVDFPLPIVACNLMIEYADFYENFQVRFFTMCLRKCCATILQIDWRIFARIQPTILIFVRRNWVSWDFGVILKTLAVTLHNRQGFSDFQWHTSQLALICTLKRHSCAKQGVISTYFTTIRLGETFRCLLWVLLPVL